MKELTAKEVIEKLEDMDRQILCVRSSRWKSVFARAAELLREVHAPVDELKGTIPVVLYFQDRKELNGFIEALKEAKPDLISKPL